MLKNRRESYQSSCDIADVIDKGCCTLRFEYENESLAPALLNLIDFDEEL